MARVPVGFTYKQWNSLPQDVRDKIKKENKTRAVYEWRQRNPDKVKAASSRYYKSHTEQCKKKTNDRYKQLMREHEELKLLLLNNGECTNPTIST